MTILDTMKIHNITPAQLAKKLDVAVSQIYYWNRHGISKRNPHFRKLKELLPEIQPKETTLTVKGKEDGRYRAGRKKKKLSLSETDLHSYREPDFESTFFPKIHITNKPR